MIIVTVGNVRIFDGYADFSSATIGSLYNDNINIINNTIANLVGDAATLGSLTKNYATLPYVEGDNLFYTNATVSNLHNDNISSVNITVANIVTTNDAT